MGRSNRIEALETKIAFLLGDLETTRADITKAEEQYARLPMMRQSLIEAEEVLQACEIVIRSDHPGWSRDHIEPKVKFTHKIPVRLGTGIRQALDVLRKSGECMTVKEIAAEVLRREGHADPDTAILSKVANTIGNGLRKGVRSSYVENDGEWPARWWTIKPK